MSSFGGTVKLTGESEYRKALSEISSNLKVLNSEMKSVTSQYEKNDKSVENLSSQNEVLNKKIEEQEKKVSILRDALAKSAAETGENSETTKKWQIELNNAQAELNKLNRDVANNAEAMKDAEKGTKDEANALEEFGKEAENSGAKALSLGDIIKANLISDLIKSGLSALADGFKAIGSAMGDCLSAGAAYADNLLTLSAQTGLSTDTLEKYNAVAELTDVSMETLTKSMSKNLKSMSDARDGSKAYAEAYKKLGVQITDANGNLRDSETVYWETIDALKGITNETERDAMAMELFGKSAKDLNTIIEMGSEGVAEYTQMAVDMGAVLGGEGLQALGDLDDQMQIFSSTTGATKNILASAFAPAMSGALAGVNALGGAFNGLVAAVISGDGVEDAFGNVSLALVELVSGIEDALPQIMSVVGNLFDMILDLIDEYLPFLIEQGADMLSSLLSGITSNLGNVMATVMSVVGTVINTVMENLPLLVEMGITMLTSLIDGIADMLPELIPMAVDCVITIVETLIDNIDMVVDAAISIVIALAEGLIDALPRLIEKVPTIVVKLVGGLIAEIPQLVKAGGQLLAGLFEGLLNPTAIWNAVKKLFNGIVGGIKELFGIHSPSKVFEDEVGANLALGLGEGFSSTMSDVTDEMASAIPTEFDADINTNMKAGSGMNTYDMMVSAFKQALTEVKVVMDDREMGGFVTDTVERVVFA